MKAPKGSLILEAVTPASGTKGTGAWPQREPEENIHACIPEGTRGEHVLLCLNNPASSPVPWGVWPANQTPTLPKTGGPTRTGAVP